VLGASHPRLGDSCWRVLIGSWARPAGGCSPRLARVFGPQKRVPLRVEGRGPVDISERDSRAVPNPRGRQVNVEPHNAVSCLRLVFSAHTSCVCASWRLLPGSLTRLPSARTGRPPQRDRPACVATPARVVSGTVLCLVFRRCGALRALVSGCSDPRRVLQGSLDVGLCIVTIFSLVFHGRSSLRLVVQHIVIARGFAPTGRRVSCCSGKLCDQYYH